MEKYAVFFYSLYARRKILKFFACQRRAALLLSWPLLLAPVALLILLRRAEVPWPRESAADIAGVLRRQLGPAAFTFCASLCALVLVLSLLVPLAQLIATTRTWSEFTPALVAGKSALLNSLLYAASAAALTLYLGMSLVRVRGLAWLWILFLIPGVLLGIGALTAFNRPGLDWFSRSAAIVVTVLVVRYFALAHSLLRAAHQSLDLDLIDAGL